MSSEEKPAKDTTSELPTQRPARAPYIDSISDRSQGDLIKSIPIDPKPTLPKKD